jgi:hypothetical protein
MLKHALPHLRSLVRMQAGRHALFFERMTSQTTGRSRGLTLSSLTAFPWAAGLGACERTVGGGSPMKMLCRVGRSRGQSRTASAAAEECRLRAMRTSKRGSSKAGRPRTCRKREGRLKEADCSWG